MNYADASFRISFDRFIFFFLRFDVQVYNSVIFSVCFHPLVFPLTNYVPRRNKDITLVAPTLKTGYSRLFHSSIIMYTICRGYIQFKWKFIYFCKENLDLRTRKGQVEKTDNYIIEVCKLYSKCFSMQCIYVHIHTYIHVQCKFNAKRGYLCEPHSRV
jgi:hypothetical protein